MDIRSVSLKQLRYFIATAETGQLSKAARSTHVSQSAITAAIKSLEELMAVRLFERKQQGVTITPEGHRFYLRAKEMLDSLEDALREPRFNMHKVKGSVKVSASYTVLGYFLPNLLARFRANYPDVEIDLRDWNRSAIERAVLDGSTELGIVIISNTENLQPFSHHILIRSRRQLWVGANHPLLKQDRVSLHDISQYPYIQITEDEGEESTKRYWELSGETLNIGLKTSSMEGLRGLIANNFGVTILSDMVYRPWSLEGKKIESRPIENQIPDMQVGIIWKKNAVLSEPAQAMRELLIQICGS
jgi:DNA-binding transcriptional LysR family regulator